MLSDIISQKSLQAVNVAHQLLEVDRRLPEDKRYAKTVGEIVDVNNRGTVASPDQLVKLCQTINNTHEIWDALSAKIGKSTHYFELRRKFDDAVNVYCEEGKSPEVEKQ